MKKNLLIVGFFIYVSLGISFGAGGQGLPSEIGGELTLGKNLTGDECKLRRVQPGDWGGKAERYLLHCEGWSLPSGRLTVLKQGKQPHAWWLEESPWAQDIQASCECEDPKAETSIEGVAAMVRSCQHRLGWRRLMLVAKSGSDLYLADFLPNNAPLIENALLVSIGKMSPVTPVAQGKRMVALRALEDMVGKNTDLPSIREIGNILELYSLGRQQHEARLYRQSELTFQRVLKTQERLFGMNSSALASTLLYMAHSVRNQRRIDDALALVKRAEPFVSKSHDPVLISQRLTNLAFDANFRRNYEAAAGFAEKAVFILPDKNRGMLAEAYYALATARFFVNDYDGFYKAARKTFDLYYENDGFYGVWTNRARMLLVKALTIRKQFDEAGSYIADALHSAEKMYGHTIWWANAKVVEAKLSSAMGNSARALESYRAFAAVAAREEFSCFYGPCLSPYLNMLEAQASVDPEVAQTALREAFSVAQLAEFPVVSTAINKLAARVGADNQELSSYTREQQDLAEKQSRLRAQLMQEMRKPEKNRSKDKEDAMDREIRRLQAQLDERELNMQDRFPRYAQLLARKPVNALQISELLQQDEGLLYFSHVGDKGYTFLLHQGQIKLHSVNLSLVQLKRKVAALRGGLTREGGKVRPFDAGAAHELYRNLFGSLLDVPGSIRRLVIIPTGPLLSLPPDVLVSAVPGTTGRTEWLARRFAILVAPDVRAFLDLRGIGKSTLTSSGFLGVGNPKFDAGTSGEVPAAPANDADAKNRGLHIINSDKIFTSDSCKENWNVRAQVSRLTKLPETGEEVRAMSTEFAAGKSTLLTGAKATKSELLKSGLESKEIIAFATHGLLPEDLYCESEPSLALAPGSPGDAQDDGLLRASEIAMMRLNANLVILSACNTAGADGQLGGESLSGLVRAFFYAGARNVLATHWPIASKPTVELTTGMMRKRAQGLNWSDALRESKLRMIDNPATSHPFFWGAFSLVGGG